MSRVEVKRIHSSFYEVAIGGGVFLKGILYGSQIVPRLNTKLVCRNYMPLILKSDLEHAFFFFCSLYSRQNLPNHGNENM